VRDVLATQTMALRKPKVRRIEVHGKLAPGVYAKDVILHIIRQLGVNGGLGYAYEYAGSTFDNFTQEERMTVCNMSIEGGARAGMIAPDDITYAYLADRPRSPKGAAWEAALARWRELPSDAGARYDRTVEIDASALEPMVTWGTNPGMVAPITGSVPDQRGDPVIDAALKYMGLQAGAAIQDTPVNVVFVGSCTNGRLSDLRAAAAVLRGRKVARGVHMLVVPGSQEVKRAAEAEGLDEVFRSAGAEWRESGCSMCLGMNGDTVPKGEYAVSTSNRNFEGRQGIGARTLLASPETAAASAVRGRVADPREFLNG
jgi:3-isopropylmalate/(R)-2-methylmalate dehydratase large subunit